MKSQNLKDFGVKEDHAFSNVQRRISLSVSLSVSLSLSHPLRIEVK